MKKPLALLALLVAPVFVAAGCNSVAPYAAIVGGHRIAQSTLDDELNAIKANAEYVKQIEAGGAKVSGTGKETFDLSFTDQVLTRQIFYKLAESELAKRHITVKTTDLTKARDSVKGQLGQGDANAGNALLLKFPTSYRDTLVRREAEISLLSFVMRKTKSCCCGRSRNRSFSAGEPRMTMSLAFRSSQVNSRLRLTRMERPAR